MSALQSSQNMSVPHAILWLDSKNPAEKPDHAKLLLYRAELTCFINAMPLLLEGTKANLNSGKTPESLKKLYGYLLTYLYHPLDLLPESESEFWGCLDDAYIAGTVYGWMQACKLEHAESGNALGASVGEWLSKTREVIPSQTARLDEMLGQLMQGRSNLFQEIMSTYEAS